MPEAGRIILRGGAVIDGTGAAARRADVAVAGGRIAAVGQVAPQPGDEVLDVAGLAVAPGFHDPGAADQLAIFHTHEANTAVTTNLIRCPLDVLLPGKPQIFQELAGEIARGLMSLSLFLDHLSE